MITVELNQFDRVYDKLCKDGKVCVMLFTSQKDQNGKYWCPSCEKIAPFYQDFIRDAKKNNLKIYRLIAGDKPTWKDPDHKYRKIPQLHVQSIPTMGVFDGTKLKTTLNGQQMMKKIQRDLMFEFVYK